MTIKLYDAWGNEIQPEKRPDERVLATASIRDRWSMYPSNGLTPQTLAAIFKEADQGNVWRQAELFEEMEEKDTHLFSILQTRRLAVTGLDFEVQPYSEDTRDQEIADFVSGVINDISDFEENLQDILDAIGKGYSVLELYWDIKDNQNIVRHLEWIHPKRVTWYNTLTPRLLTEENPYNGVEMPPFKSMFHLHKARSGHPNRQGVLRTAAWMYLFKNYDIKDWVAFAEVFGMPLRLGKYESTASKEDKEALFEAVRSLGRDAAGVISKATEIEFVEAVKNSGREVYDVLADFCNSEMSKAILGQTLTTQQGESGSYALGSVHNDVRADLTRSDCEMIAKTLRRDLIRPLVGYNFGWDAPLPWFKFHYEEPEDLTAEAGQIKTLTEAGVKTIPVKWVHEKFNIPMPQNGEETISLNSPQNFIPSGGNPGTVTQMVNKSCPMCLVNKGDVSQGQSTEGQVAIDNATNALSPEDLQAQMAGVLKPVTDMIKNGEDYNKILENLATAYPNMDDKAIEDMLTRAIFVSELWGRLNATRG
ncbi:MAG TPA: DUF935 domain-containing protein [Candidatus Wunengus sp. YC60]|uniref:DUF935 domain-containing protein n=1 Tax=Candidatus Wunengus sp. YC60 TaxID=3367697 RepID=UPI004027C2F2